MERTEREREFRLRPRKARLGRSECVPWPSGFRVLMHYARATSKSGIRRTYAGKGRTGRPYHQRCAVRVTYLNNKTHGQWKAHGRYLARESAAHTKDSKDVGFDRGNEPVDIASRLSDWEKAGDQRLWKLIISPEFGEKVDLTRLTRALMRRVAQDLGTDLEWIAVEHYNTKHAHVHIVLRGLRDDGEVLRMSRQYLQKGIREIAEQLCTRELGYRTQLDAAEAERREITEKRFTSLDRRLIRHASEISLMDGQEYFAVVRTFDHKFSETTRLHAQHEAARLVVLQRMGLAESTGAGNWLVRRDFEQVLRAMQRVADRQKTLARHGALMSDERLPIETLDLLRITGVEGRVLVHGQDEQFGRSHLMIESTDAKVYFIQNTPEMEEARSRGELQVNSFVRLRNLSRSGNLILDVQGFGDAEVLLTNRQYFRNAARSLLKRGIKPSEDGWGGWLGRYQVKLAEEATRIAEMEHHAPPTNQRKRQRDLSFGR